MALGLCCEWVETHPKKGMVNQLVARHLQLGRFNKGEYSSSHIQQTYLANLKNLLELLPIIQKSGIHFFRLSSSLFPLFDKVPSELFQNAQVTSALKQTGDFFLQNGFRVTTHPAQFVVLSSDDPGVVANAVQEVNFHGWVFDQMGLPRTPYYSINVHGGKGGRALNLIKTIQQLPETSRLRLTLENDEFAYSVKELEVVSRITGTPIVFDSHHHSFNDDGLPSGEAMEIALGTWVSGVKPTTHLSNTPPQFRHLSSVTKKRTHSEYIDNLPEKQLEAYQKSRIDIEVEAKAKNLALLQMATKFGLTI